ncbi:MAG TPA: copper resistance protein CopC [Devosia sp.]|nr:copper resistance protein CopC [Devosia sp.]
MRHGPAAGAALLALVLVLGLWPAAAPAHASLLAVRPADGTTVASAPASLSLEFNEQVAPVTVTLVTPDGRALPLRADVEGPQLNMPMPSGLGNGTYGLSWRVISADGHPVGGTTIFSVGAPSSGGVPAAAAEAMDWPVRTGVWLTRVLTYAGLFAGVGGVFFLRWLGDGTSGLRAVRAVTIVGLVALPIEVAFQGLDVLDQSPASLFAPATWQAGMSSSFGLFAGLALIGFALALVATVRVGYERLWSALGLLCVGAALAATGHASTADPQWLTRPAVFIHTEVAAFWAGALLPLGALLRGAGDAAIGPLRRFSAAIPALLFLLLAAGATLAIVQVGAPAELVESDYGRVLIAKLVLVAALLGLSAFNRFRLTKPALADSGLARRQLVRSIGVELAIMLAIFAVVALWRFTPPPRALLEAMAQPVSLELSGKEAMAEVTVTPGRAGPVTADITLMGADMGPLQAQGVTVDFSNPAKKIEPIEREAKPAPGGKWHLDGLTLPVGGTWRIELDILVSDFKEIDLSDQVDIRP